MDGHLEIGYLVNFKINHLIQFEVTIYNNYRPQTKFEKIMFSQMSVCPGGGVHGWGRHAWQRERGLYGGMPGRRDGHCSGRYAFYWNAFLFPLILQRPSSFYYLLSLGNYIYRIFICVSHNTDVRTLAFQAYVARLSALIIYQKLVLVLLGPRSHSNN